MTQCSRNPFASCTLHLIAPDAAQVCVALLREPSTAHPHPTRQARDMHRAGMSLPSAEGITRLKLTADQPEQQRQKQGQQSKDPPAHPLDRVANMRASASIMNRLVENGFYMHRLVRARLLHYFICELVGTSAYTMVGTLMPCLVWTMWIQANLVMPQGGKRRHATQ